MKLVKIVQGPKDPFEDPQAQLPDSLPPDLMKVGIFERVPVDGSAHISQSLLMTLLIIG